MRDQVPPEWFDEGDVVVADEEPVVEEQVAEEAPVEVEERPVEAEQPPLRRAQGNDGSSGGRFYDLASEQQVIGWMLQYPAEVERVCRRFLGEEFFNSLHRKIFGAIYERWARGLPTDPPSLVEDGLVFADLLDLVAICDLVAPEPLMADLIELAKRRTVARTLTDALSTLRESGPGMVADDVLEGVQEQLEAVPAIGSTIESAATTWNDVALRADDRSEWVIDGLLGERHRAILVAPEGAGKSSVLRQVAFAAALGVHPFHRRPLRNGPVPTLTVDLENPHDVVSAMGKWLVRAAAKTDMGTGRNSATNAPAYLIEWEGGIDIRKRPDRARLEHELKTIRPKLLVIGPIYKMFEKSTSESDEEVAAEVCRILDDWRVRFDMAILMEHHAPHGGAGGRSLRPVGSSFWLRWPEFGLTMQRHKERDKSYRYPLGRFRGDRVNANWPSALDRRPNEVWPVTGFWADGKLGQDDPSQIPAGGPQPW